MDNQNVGIYLEELEIQNFRSIDKYVIDNFGNFTSITGRNSSGKSSIIEALSLLGSNKMHEYSDIPAWYPSNKISYNDIEIRLSYLFRLNQRFDEVMGDQRIFDSLLRWYDDLNKSSHNLQRNGPLEGVFQKSLYKAIRDEFKRFGQYQQYPTLFTPDNTIKKSVRIFEECTFFKLILELDYYNGPHFRFFLLNNEKEIVVNDDVFYHMLNKQDSIDDPLSFGQAFGEVFIKSVIAPSITINANKHNKTLLLRDGSNIKEYIEHCFTYKPSVLKKLSHSFEFIIDSSINFKKGRICCQSSEEDILIEIGKSDYWFSIDKLSSGLFNLLRILLQVEVAEKGDILIIDEPELHLHPGSAKRLRNILFEKKNEIQIICVTHSPVFLDTNFVDTVILNRNIGNSIEPTILNSNEIDEALSQLGSSGSDFLLYDIIIWVEGPTDRIYFKKWIDLMAKDMKIELSSRIGILVYGGGNIKHFDIATIKQVNRNSIFVIDSDRSYEECGISDQSKELKSKCEENGIFCLVTERRTIENYIPSNLLESVYNMPTNSLNISKYDNVITILKDNGRNYTKMEIANSVIKKLEITHIKNDIEFYNELNLLIEKLAEMS